MQVTVSFTTPVYEPSTFPGTVAYSKCDKNKFHAFDYGDAQKKGLVNLNGWMFRHVYCGHRGCNKPITGKPFDHIPSSPLAQLRKLVFGSVSIPKKIITADHSDYRAMND